MSITPKSDAATGEFSAQQILDLTVAANQVATNSADVNAYDVRNAIVLRWKKSHVQYLNGYTSQPASVMLLLANAEDLTYNHRRTLARNIVAGGKAARPADSAAHHVVALADPEARPARLLIFSWGIGINDADNGVFLPRHGVGSPGYPNAAHHSPYHKLAYHLGVLARLQRANDQPGGRTQLRAMKADLQSGRMTLKG